MRKFYLALCALLLSVGLFAKNGPLISYGLADYQLTYLSSNGKWACGTFSNGYSMTYGFLWNLETDECKLLSEGDDQTMATAVSDNGVVAGIFPDKEVTKNGAPVMTAGYWKEGKWYHLETIDGYVDHPDYGGQAMGISHNGEFVTGALYDKEHVYTPLLWKEGKIYSNFAAEGVSGIAFCASNDGSIAGGWVSTPISGGTRVSVLWKDGKSKYLCDENKGDPWRCGKRLSPNEKYMLYDTEIYDLETGDITHVFPIVNQPYNFDVYAMTDNKTVVGYESTEDGSEQYAIIYKDGRTRKFVEYLKEKGVDLAKDGVVRPYPDREDDYMVTLCLGVSGDEKVFAAMVADVEGNYRPMIIRFDENISTREPVSLTGSQLEGIHSIKLLWNVPLANEEAVKGYNVYRNGTKINTSLVTGTQYLDADLANGSYEYAVTAVYDIAESKKSVSAVVTVADKKIAAPHSLYARQKGLNNALLLWNTPTSNLTNKKYYNTGDLVSGFGGGINSFESAICFEEKEMQLYKDCKITNVTFYPMSRQNEWTINIYKDKEVIYTEKVTDELKYGVENNIKLKKPVSIPESGNVYVGIAVSVPSNVESYNVIGQVYDSNCLPGYSDLVRQADEKDFYSLQLESHKQGYDFPVIWAISMVLSPENASDDIDKINGYNIYANQVKIGNTTENTYLLKDQTEGDYTYEVEAVYADNRISGRAATNLTIANNENVYKAISNVAIENNGSKIVARWTAPQDNDETFITYSGEQAVSGIKGNEDGGWGYRVKAVYDKSKLQGYGSYQVKTVRFYPLSDAEFTFMIYKNGEEICSQYVGEYTLGQWNTVLLDEPFALEEGATYDLVLDCFDGTPEQAPLALDGEVPFVGISDLYSTNEGDSYSSLYSATSAVGNWMIGMVITAPETNSLPVQGYNVRIDKVKKNENLLATTEFEYDFGEVDAETHRINVDVVYNAIGQKDGNAVFFTLGGTGIEDNQITVIRVFPNPATNYVKVEGGDVTSVIAYTTAGQQVAQSDNNVLNVSGLDAGMYILKIRIDGQDKTTKLNVIK